jgi:hypothetical protein
VAVSNTAQQALNIRSTFPYGIQFDKDRCGLRALLSSYKLAGGRPRLEKENRDFNCQGSLSDHLHVVAISA